MIKAPRLGSIVTGLNFVACTIRNLKLRGLPARLWDSVVIILFFWVGFPFAIHAK